MEFESYNAVSNSIEPLKSKSKTSHRIQYESEVDLIKKQIGDLETIRNNLGLSARKMAQLLLVDPSAWTRWTQKITPPPPHIYRALQWYLSLQEKNPGFTPQFFLSTQTFIKGEKQKELLEKIQQLELQVQNLGITEKSQRDALEKKIEIYKKRVSLLIFSLFLVIAIFIFKTLI